MRSVLAALIVISLATSPAWPRANLEKQQVAVLNFVPDGEKNTADAHPGDHDDNTTLTVMSPLANSPDQAWLSKAIADLLIKNLSEVQALTILERNKMQAFSEEVGLGDSALFSQEKALRVGRVAKVQQVIFGNYHLRGERITIQVYLMVLRSQKILRREIASGKLSELRSIVSGLVLRLLSKQVIPLTDQEKKNIVLEASDSIGATEHFYRALDFYDRGAYPEALGRFAAARRQDPAYLEAHLWMGRSFEALGYHQHAVQAYGDLFAVAPRSIEGLDAQFFAAKIFESYLQDSARAIEMYRHITIVAPDTPHAIEAYFQLGGLLDASGRFRAAYEAFAKVDAFRTKVIRNPTSLKTGRMSRFVTRRHALNLHRDAIVNMISLYTKMIQAGIGPEEADLPEPPRGLIVLDVDRPHFRSHGFDDRTAIFKEVHEHPHWRERLYAVVVPKGYVATGVDFSVTGQLMKMRPFHSYTMRILPFPLTRDFDRRWLGAIFGQTPDTTTLHKSISFYGENRRVFSVQLLESRSRIDRWTIDVRLQPEDQIKDLSDLDRPEDHHGFWEGKSVGQLTLPDVSDPGATRSSAQAYYRSKKEIDVLYAPGGDYVLATTVGDLDGQQTDIWVSKSHDGVNWTQLTPISANSLSDDFNPRLLRSESGEVWLSWVSTRRGMGWELWLAQLVQGDSTHRARRVPFDQFLDTSGKHDKRGQKEVTVSNELLEYDLYQNHRGQWTAVCYDPAMKQVVFLRSSDLERWQHLASIPVQQTAFGLSLIQDHSGVYRLGYLGKNGKIHLWRSNDCRSWTKRQFAIQFWNQSFFPTPGSHRMRLLPLRDSRLLMLVADNQYGLQYSRFHPDAQQPLLDLVSRAGLEPYGVTPVPVDSDDANHGEYLVALKDSDRITLRRYRSFNVNGRAIKKDTRNWPIYMETESDRHGNTWHRIFAQVRRIVPDVTSLGIDPAGRIWWGIESGVMYKQGEQFLATDVSLGFFYHLVTHITGARDGRVWFSSTFLDEPTLGYVRNPRPIIQTLSSGKPPRFLTVRVPKIHGAITDTTPGNQGSEIFLGTSQGQVVGFDGHRLFFERSFASSITAVKFDPITDNLWVGTGHDGLYQLHKEGASHFGQTEGVGAGAVLDIELDARGFLWAAVRSHGLYRYEPSTGWRQYSPENSDVLYWSIGKIVADARAGVWYLPHGEERSRGVGYFDGNTGETYNPPHQVLDKPSSIVVDEQGDIWIGTWFDGLYRLERKQQ